MLSRVAFWLLLVLIVAPLGADFSRPVHATFRGQLVVSKDELRAGKSDKDTIAKIKAMRLAAIVGEKRDGIHYWSFRYTAFLARTGSERLQLLFKGQRVVPSKTLDGIDPKASLLDGDITINQDEGVEPGKTYSLVLVNAKGQALASANVTFR